VGKVRWYKRDPNAALTGMAGLTLEERGAYNTILDLIYANDGAVADDDRFIAGWLRVDVRVWRRIRKQLLDLEKLYRRGQSLRNARADREVEEALDRVRSAAEAGLASAAKRVERRNIINGLGSTIAERLFQLSTTTKKNLTSLSSEQAAARARGKEDLSVSREDTDKTPALKRPSELTRAELDQAITRKASPGPPTPPRSLSVTDPPVTESADPSAEKRKADNAELSEPGQ